jgi:prophage tail gpP-like protein
MSAEIKINGVVYGGWKTARIERGIEQIAGSFELGVSERWPGQDTPRQIKRGERCEVLADGETVITGWVDDARPSYTDTQHDFQVSGRDAAGDLVDCAAIHKSGQWMNAALDRVVRDVCAPFKILVSVETDMGKAFESFSIQEGEAAYECIERACRMRAVLPVSDGKGGLVLTRAKETQHVAELVEGVNILAASGEFGMKERYSKYIVKGQDRGSDDDLETPETHSQVRAEASDSFVTRYRPLVVLAEGRGPHATYKDRAAWERNVRRGRSSRATVTVQGWRTPGGKLWQPNTMVRLTSPWLGVDAELLVASVALTLDEQNGTRAELRLCGREAFDLIAGKQSAGLSGKIREKQASAKKSGDEWSVF